MKKSIIILLLFVMLLSVVVYGDQYCNELIKVVADEDDRIDRKSSSIDYQLSSEPGVSTGTSSGIVEADGVKWVFIRSTLCKIGEKIKGDTCGYYKECISTTVGYELKCGFIAEKKCPVSYGGSYEVANEVGTKANFDRDVKCGPNLCSGETAGNMYGGGSGSALTRAGRTEESQTGLTTSTGTQSAPSDASTSTLTMSKKSSPRISPLRRTTSISPIGGATSILNPNNTVSTLVNLLVLASFAIGLIYVFKHD